MSDTLNTVQRTLEYALGAPVLSQSFNTVAAPHTNVFAILGHGGYSKKLATDAAIDALCQPGQPVMALDMAHLSDNAGSALSLEGFARKTAAQRNPVILLIDFEHAAADKRAAALDMIRTGKFFAPDTSINSTPEARNLFIESYLDAVTFKDMVRPAQDGGKVQYNALSLPALNQKHVGLGAG